MNRSQRRAMKRKPQIDRNKGVAAHGALNSVLKRVVPYSSEELALVQSKFYLALAAFKDGTATPADMRLLLEMCGTCRVLGERINPACVALADRGIEALERADQRRERTGHFGLDGEGIATMADLMAYHDQLTELATPHQLLTAVQEFYKYAEKA